MSFIKNLVDNKIDEKTHLQFSRFSKGTFENRAILEINVSKDKIKLKTSAEFTNELVELLANTIKEKVPVKGTIFSTRDLSKESPIKFTEIKSAMGIKKHILNQELTKDQILDLCNNFPNASHNLTFETDWGMLKVKEKAPKSGKSTKEDGETPKPDFCVLVTGGKEILKEYAFDIKENFKKTTINHTYIIEDIEIPEKYKNDFNLARLYAVRKGKILRKLNIDGKEKIEEILLNA